MLALPDQLRFVLEQKGTVYEMAKVFKYASNFLFLGRGYHYPVALEGARSSSTRSRLSLTNHLIN